MNSLLRITIFAVTIGANSPLPAEDSTTTFLERCQEANRCESEIYLLLDGDPVLNREYACLMAQDDPPLPRRIVEWLRANKAQSDDDLLDDVYSALEALKGENLHGTC